MLTKALTQVNLALEILERMVLLREIGEKVLIMVATQKADCKPELIETLSRVDGLMIGIHKKITDTEGLGPELLDGKIIYKKGKLENFENLGNEEIFERIFDLNFENKLLQKATAKKIIERFS